MGGGVPDRKSAFHAHVLSFEPGMVLFFALQTFQILALGTETTRKGFSLRFYKMHSGVFYKHHV